MDKTVFAEPIPYALELINVWSGFGGGAPVSSENMPTKLRLNGRKRKLLDFSNQHHMLLVNRRFIDVVERFQKDVQTFPLDCVWSDGSAAGRFFFFFTTVLLDAVDREKTTATWVPTRRGGMWTPQLHLGETLTFDKARMGDTHMWVDPNMPTEGALVSEALFAALKAAEIRLFYDLPRFEEI